MNKKTTTSIVLKAALLLCFAFFGAFKVDMAHAADTPAKAAGGESSSKDTTQPSNASGAADTQGQQSDGRFADDAKLVTETHAASLKRRDEALRKTIKKDMCFPGDTWGDNLWCLAALYLNEKVDEANARLLKRAKDYIASHPSNAPRTLPEAPANLPWTFFSVADYVRTLYLFSTKSPHFPGRLKADTEAAMKESLWLWVHDESRLAEVGADDLLLLLGTENHDLLRRPSYYLVTALLKEDPTYRDRKLADGHTVAEHADAYTAFYREWPRKRAEVGLWIEIGSNTYQKYSWPGLFNLHELAPDPVIRKRFGLLLDLAFIEEEQMSVQGRRGGGRSRAYPGSNNFDPYKNLLYATKGQPAGSSHSRVIETSRYQLPPEAIYLRYRAFPAAQPFVIRNRVLGEVEPPKLVKETGERFAADSALVNYAWRTPHYLLGSTLQNPALSKLDPKTGKSATGYSGISRQNRACGMLFDDPGSAEICSVHSVIGHGTGGRPQHPLWSVQHENVLILQRIAPEQLMGSYSTGSVGIGFTGKSLIKLEKDGWIFGSNGKAFVGVKFLDGPYQWDEKGEVATPAHFDPTKDQSRILVLAGDIASDGTFEKFQSAALANDLKITADDVDFHFGQSGHHLQVARYDPHAPDRFKLPLINGNPVDLHPPTTFQSPYLNSVFGSDKISVTVGQNKRVLDFSGE